MELSQNSVVEPVWLAFKDAIHEAHRSLPKLPRKQEADWVSDELRNLSQKKDAWLRLRDVGKHSCTADLKLEYQRLCKLTKIAAEKARKAWWSARAVEAERRAWVVEQSGHGGSLIKELRLLRSHSSKPSAASLSAKDGSDLTRDVDKLHLWAEHFAEVNCGVNVNEATLEALPVVIPCPENVSNAPNNECQSVRGGNCCCHLPED